MLGAHLVPIAIEFFSDELCKAGQRALAHFGTRDTHYHFIIRAHQHP